MHVSQFASGGFVAHKIHVAGRESRFSIWCDDSGRLLDAERIDAAGRIYTVKRDGDLWRELQGKAIHALARIEATGIRPIPRHIGELAGTPI